MNLKDGVKKTISVTKKLGKNGVQVSKDIQDVEENGADQTIKQKLKAKAKSLSKKGLKKGVKNGVKLAIKAGRTFISFILSGPLGWLCGAIIIALFCALMSSGKKDDNIADTSQRRHQYAALMLGGCPTTTGPSADSLIDFGGGGSKSNWSLNDVAKFSTSSIKSTWGVSISKAEGLFLQINRVTASKYGLNKNNIGEVSQAIKNEGVSPVFFWLYSCNEVGGAGGFINHFQGDTGNAKQDAIADAKVIKDTSNNTSQPPATGGGEPGDLPVDPAKKLLDAVPTGSIGKAYIPLTSAATAEIADLAGKHGGWTGKFNKPLSATMDNIKELGGDPSKGDQISVDTDSNGNSCNDGTVHASGKWGWPFKDVTQDPMKNYEDGQQFGHTGFGRGNGNFHDGFDFGSAKYHGDVIAVHDGKVKFVGYKYGFWIVWVVSDDGYNEVYQEAFGSKSDINVKEGQNVKVGDTIGKLTQSHLHLGITNKKITDPCQDGYSSNGPWEDPIKVIKSGLGESKDQDKGDKV